MNRYTIHDPKFDATTHKLIGRKVGETDNYEEAKRIALETEDVATHGHVQIIFDHEENTFGDAHPAAE